MSHESRKLRAMERNLSAFEAKHPDIAAWWTGNPFQFAVSLRDYVMRNGELTEKQQASAEKCVKMMKDRQIVDKEQSKEEFPTANLHRAIGNARARGSKAPKIRCMVLIDDIHEVLVEFKAVQQHSGDHIFTSVNRDYQGRIEGVHLNRRTDICGSFEVQVIREALENIEEAAILYGRRTGSCSCCNRELTNEESISLGIGPICREKFFL